MIKISTDRNGNFLIKLSGIRKTYKVKTIEEVYIAMNHYYNNFHDKENCVLCKS